MTTLEQVIEAVRQWPLAERRRLRGQLLTMEQQEAAWLLVTRPQGETVEQQIERFRRVMQWIEEHRAEYLGQWVALEGDQLISHGSDALQVHNAAKAAGIVSPFLERIEEEEVPYWGGWL